MSHGVLKRGQKLTLGNKEDRVCRFCGLREPQVSFRKDAHAIAEMLGNKSLFTAYECDTCNGKFGRGIEQDLGNWSKLMRTMSRIRGKNGVPTLKRGGNTGWRIEYRDDGGLDIKDYEANPVHTVDEARKSVQFRLKRDPYTPVGVMKAFVKMGLTLLPEDEMPNFKHALAW
jgi:HNH endonuclease